MYYLSQSRSFFIYFTSHCFFFFFPNHWVLNQKIFNKLGGKERLAEGRKETLKRVLCFFDEIVLMCSRRGGRMEERENCFFLLLCRAMNNPWSHSTPWVWGLLSLKDISFQEGLEIKNRPQRILSTMHVLWNVCKKYLWQWDGSLRAERNIRR